MDARLCMAGLRCNRQTDDVAAEVNRHSSTNISAWLN